NRLAREVSMTFLSEHYDRKRFRERPTLFRLRDGRRDADLIFTSFAHERLHVDAKESDQALFEYSVGPDPKDGSKRDLFRRVKPLLDEGPERGGEKAVLPGGVGAFSVGAWERHDRERGAGGEALQRRGSHGRSPGSAAGQADPHRPRRGGEGEDVHHAIEDLPHRAPGLLMERLPLPERRGARRGRAAGIRSRRGVALILV